MQIIFNLKVVILIKSNFLKYETSTQNIIFGIVDKLICASFIQL
jgi:hypothetical protein